MVNKRDVITVLCALFLMTSLVSAVFPSAGFVTEKSSERTLAATPEDDEAIAGNLTERTPIGIPDGSGIITSVNNSTKTIQSSQRVVVGGGNISVVNTDPADSAANIIILYPIENQVIDENFVEFKFVLKGDLSVDYCDVELYNKESKEKEYEQKKNSLLLNEEYKIKISDLENNEYVIRIECEDFKNRKIIETTTFTIQTESGEIVENLENSSSESAEVLDENQIDKPMCSSGCEYNSRCIPIGTRLNEENGKVYCDISGMLEKQVGEDEFCQNDFECLSGECKGERCVNLQEELDKTNKKIDEVGSRVEENSNMLEQIFKFLKGLIGFE